MKMEGHGGGEDLRKAWEGKNAFNSKRINKEIIF